MIPLTLEQARRLAATERRWLADSTDRLRRPARNDLLDTTVHTDTEGESDE